MTYHVLVRTLNEPMRTLDKLTFPQVQLPAGREQSDRSVSGFISAVGGSEAVGSFDGGRWLWANRPGQTVVMETFVQMSRNLLFLLTF